MDASRGEVFLCARVPGGAPGVLPSGKVHDTEMLLDLFTHM